jgi:hypothetical protein
LPGETINGTLPIKRSDPRTQISENFSPADKGTTLTTPGNKIIKLNTKQEKE